MSRRNSREISSYRGGNGNASSNFAYGNTAGIYRFDANPIPSNNYSSNGNGNGNGGGGGSNRITITNINGNGQLNVSGSRLSMTSIKSSLPNQSQSQSQSRSRQRTTGGAQLHPNDYKMVQYFNSLPTKFTMGGGRKSHTR